MVTFEFLDWLWVACFILIMVGAGVLFYRLGKRSESDFFLARRGLPWWLVYNHDGHCNPRRIWNGDKY